MSGVKPDSTIVLPDMISVYMLSVLPPVVEYARTVSVFVIVVAAWADCISAGVVNSIADKIIASAVLPYAFAK